MPFDQGTQIDPYNPAAGDMSGTFLTGDESKNYKGEVDYVAQLQKEQDQATKDATRLSSATPYANTSEAQKMASQNQQGILRTNVADAAKKGLMHSGALGQINDSYLQGQALARVGLLGQEIQTRQAMLQKLQGELETMKKGEQSIPVTMEGVNVNATLAPGPNPYNVYTETTTPNSKIPVFEQERKRITDNNIALTQAVAKLSVMPPREEDLRAQFHSAIDAMYQREEGTFLQEAQARGMSADQIKGLQGQMEQGRQHLYDIAAGLATELSSNDPSRIASALGALNTTPVQPEQTVKSQVASPLWGLIPGLAGAAIGGLASGGNPAAIGAGWSIGATGGQLAGQEFG